MGLRSGASPSSFLAHLCCGWVPALAGMPKELSGNDVRFEIGHLRCPISRKMKKIWVITTSNP